MDEEWFRVAEEYCCVSLGNGGKAMDPEVFIYRGTSRWHNVSQGLDLETRVQARYVTRIAIVNGKFWMVDSIIHDRVPLDL